MPRISITLDGEDITLRSEPVMSVNEVLMLACYSPEFALLVELVDGKRITFMHNEELDLSRSRVFIVDRAGWPMRH